eukprot:3912795-Pyramimonas_sp.AAC.1
MAANRTRNVCNDGAMAAARGKAMRESGAHCICALRPSLCTWEVLANAWPACLSPGSARVGSRA